MVFKSPREKLWKIYDVPYEKTPPGTPEDVKPKPPTGKSVGERSDGVSKPDTVGKVGEQESEVKPQVIAHSRIHSARDIVGKVKSEIERRTYHARTEGYSPQEWYQKIDTESSKIQQLEYEYKEKISGIDPDIMYQVEGESGLVLGSELIEKWDIRYGQPLEKASTQAQLAKGRAHALVREAHPDVRIKKTDEGFKLDVPFAGAEKYTTYKKMIKENPGQATALGWGWGGLGNVDIAYYKLTGQKEKALQRQISQLAVYKSAKESLASGDIVGFSKQYWYGYFTMPSTQIGMAFGISAIATKAVPFVVGATTTKFGPVAGMIVKGGMVGAGGALVAHEGLQIKGLVEKGRIGEAIGRVNMLGLMVSGAYAGYRSVGGRAAAMASYEAGASRVKPFQVKKLMPTIGRYTPEVMKEVWRSGRGFRGLVSDYKGYYADIRMAKDISSSYTKRYHGFPEHEVSRLASFVDYEIPIKSKLFIGKKMFLASDKPIQRSINIYGRKGMVSQYEDVVAREQIVGKRPDPFISYKGDKLYPMTWEGYSESIPVLTPYSKSMKIPYKIKYDSGLTVEDTISIFKQGKRFINPYSELPYRGSHPYSWQKETGVFPEEFTTGRSPVLVDYNKLSGGNLRFSKDYFKKIDVSLGKPVGVGKPVSTVQTYKGGTSQLRGFKPVLDTTDYRLLVFLESTEPPYASVTSRLTPSSMRKTGFIRSIGFDRGQKDGGVSGVFDGVLKPDDIHFGMVKEVDLDVGKTRFKLESMVYTNNLLETQNRRVFGEVDSDIRNPVYFNDVYVLSGDDVLLSNLQKQRQSQMTEYRFIPELDLVTVFDSPHKPSKIPYSVPYQTYTIEQPFKPEIGVPYRYGLLSGRISGGGRRSMGFDFFRAFRGYRSGELFKPFNIEV